MKKWAIAFGCGLGIVVLSIVMLFITNVNALHAKEKLTFTIHANLNGSMDFYSGEANFGIVLFFPIGDTTYKPMVQQLLLSGANIGVVEYPNGSEDEFLEQADALVYSSVQALSQRTALPPQEIVVMGYDWGANLLLEHLVSSQPQYKGMVVIAPDLRQGELFSTTISGGVYQNDNQWLNLFSNDLIQQPTLLLTSTTDDLSSPYEVTQLYNKLSGDVILGVGGGYHADNNDVYLDIVTGVFHRYLAFSSTTLQQISAFFTQAMGIEMAGIPNITLTMRVASWPLLFGGLLLLLAGFHQTLRYKTKSITSSIQPMKLQSPARFLGFKLLLWCGSGILGVILYQLFKNATMGFDGGSLVFLCILATYGVLSLLAYLFSKTAGITGSIHNKAIGVPALHYVWGVLYNILPLGVAWMMAYTGFAAQIPTFSDLLCALLVGLACIPWFYVAICEDTMLTAFQNTIGVHLGYMVAVYLPLAILLGCTLLLMGFSALLSACILLLCLIVVNLVSRGMMILTSNALFTAAISSLTFGLLAVVTACFA